MLLLSLALVVVLITRLRFHPFIALMLSAIFVGLLSPSLPSPDVDHVITAVELPMTEFGATASKIAWVIALAAVIGACLMESGAAERIVGWLLDTLGERRAAVALLASGYILSVPVFFDTVFFLLIPLGITLALRTGRDFVLYVTAIAGGGVITHSVVPPTPGPLVMAETFHLDLGVVIIAGTLAGIIPATAGLLTGKWLNRKLNLPVRVEHASVTDVQQAPSLFFSLLPIAAPVLMISLASIADAWTGDVPPWVAFQGNKNIAMGTGALIALIVLARTKKLGSRALWDTMARPLEVAGSIILITSAGGAYGTMIQHGGIGKAIALATADFHINYVLLGWIISVVMKTAQGSGTVAMITTSAIMVSLIGTDAALPYHPVYILLAIGFGSVFVSWMNDSAFWVVARMSGFTEQETLRTWTFLLMVISVVGVLQILLLSRIFPLV